MGSRSKLTLTLVLGLVLALGVAACGGGSDSSSGDSSSGGGSTAEAEIDGKVVVWDFEYESVPGYTKSIDKIDAEFEKLHPGVEIERVPQALETYLASYRAAFVAHEGPDVMVLGPGAALTFQQGLEDLDERISPEMREDLLLWEIGSPEFKNEGPQYGVPIGSFGYAYYYNREQFKKAGLPTDFEPESFDELREAAEKLKAAGVQPFAAGDKEGAENLYWFSMALEGGASEDEIKELARNEIPWTGELATEAFQPQIEMQDSGVYEANRFSKSLFTETLQEFPAGEGAMMLGFTNGFLSWGEFNPVMGEENVGAFLTPGKDFPVGVTPLFELGIPSFSENKDAAWAMVEFDSGKVAQGIMQEVGSYMSNRTDLGLPASFPSQPRQFLREMRERGTQVIPNTYMSAPLVEGPLQLEMNEVLQGRKTLEEAQQVMQETAEKTPR